MPIVKRSSRGSRDALIEAGARVLATEGHGAFTVRRLADEMRVSTKPLYSAFSGKEELVAAIIEEGFSRLARRIADWPRTDNPLVDIFELNRIYRASALDNPHLYAVTFGGRRVSPTEDLPTGVGPLFANLVEVVARCMHAGALPSGEPLPAALMLFAAGHGLVSLELAGTFGSPGAGEAASDAWLATALVGLGADRSLVDQARQKPAKG